MKNLSLSVCMIVKNEEEYLPFVLKSIENIASEIIIVDTGSKDNTIEIAKSFGAVVKNFEWNDNFADARNESLKYPTQDWILVLDADCIFDNESINMIGDCLKKSETSVYFLKWFENDSEVNNETFLQKPGDKSYISLMPCLFRNNLGLKYNGRVYEKLMVADNSEIADIYIRHNNNKFKNNKSDLRKKFVEIALEQDNNDHFESLFYKSKVILFNISQFDKNSDNDAFVKLKDQILDLDNEIRNLSSKFSKQLYNFDNFYSHAISFFLRESSEPKISADLIINALNLLPDSLNILFHLSNITYNSERYDETIKILTYIEFVIKNKPFPKIHGFSLPLKFLDIDNVYYLLSISHFEMSNYEYFDYYMKKIENFSLYQEKYNIFKQIISNKSHQVNFIQELITKKPQSSFLNFRMARELTRELEFSKANDVYLEALKLAFIEENQIIQKLIFSDLLLNSVEFDFDNEFIRELIHEGEQISDNFSYFWYSLGKHFLNNGNLNESLKYLEKAEKIENDIKNSLNEIHLLSTSSDFAEILFSNINDELLHNKINESISFINYAIKNNFSLIMSKWDNIFTENIEYWKRIDYSKALNYFFEKKDEKYLFTLKKFLTDTLEGTFPEEVINGDVWPSKALTMIGLKRMDNLQNCIKDIIDNNIPGDFIEAGVWRGGSVIFMRAMLKFYEIENKKVYAADSFQGLPKAEPEKFPADSSYNFHQYDFLAVSLDEVKRNFEKYNMLDDQVIFLKGWFKDTLKEVSFEKLSLLRVDGDMYSSTWEILENLYHKLSPGGYVILDDYYITCCNKAVEDFRKMHNITEEIIKIDNWGVYWKKLI